jgi:pimeloyl-ACP methyl ester carboxylesterase
MNASIFLPPFEPVAFGATSGMLHGSFSDTGIVICDDWGYDAQCARRSLRILADRLASKGYAVLRYDHPGMGESLPPADDITTIDDHRSALDEAIAVLRRKRGVEHVLIIGLGYGSALTLDHLQRSTGEISGAVLMAPILSGRAWLRELQVKAAMIADVNGVDLAREEGIALTIAGLNMPDGLASEIKALRFSDTTVPKELAALVLNRPGRMNEAEFATQIADAGEKNASAVFEGYDRLMTDPTATVTPDGDLDTITAWIEERFPATPGKQTFEPSTVAAMAGDGFLEKVVLLGRETQIVGTLCEPAVRKTAATVLFFGSGGTPRSGWAGQTKSAARWLACRGISSLRIDVSDIGDSRPISSGDPIVHYGAEQIADVQDAVDFLKAEGASRIVAVGACSGAYLALRGAIADHRITDVVAVNLQRFLWDPRDDIAGALRFDHTDTSGYARKLFSRSGLVKLFSGDVPVLTLLRFLFVRASRKIERQAAPYLFGLSTFARVYRQVHAELQELIDRGVPVDLVFSEADPGIAHMEHILGTDGQRAGAYPGLNLTFMADADHNLTPVAAREIVRRKILDAVEGPISPDNIEIRVAAE